MARVATFQNKDTISIPRRHFMSEVVLNHELSKTDIRVFLHLLTQLDAYEYKPISKKGIAEDLDISKKEVEKSILNLIDNEIIIFGGGAVVKKGYKFVF